MYLCMFLSVYLSPCVCLCLCFSVPLCMCIFLCVSVRLMCLPVSVFLCPSVYVYLSVCVCQADDNQKKADRLYELKMRELDQRACELQHAEEECRRAINEATKSYNLAQVLISSIFYASALPTRGHECVYILQMFFLFVAFSVCHKNTRQPFSGTAERIFMKLLPNDSGENGVCLPYPNGG